MSQESHSIPPHIVHCSLYDPGWVTPFPFYSGDFSIGLSCRIRLWVRFYSKICASQFFFQITYIFTSEKRVVIKNIVQSKYLMNDKDLNAMNSINISNNLNITTF